MHLFFYVLNITLHLFRKYLITGCLSFHNEDQFGLNVYHGKSFLSLSFLHAPLQVEG